MATRAFFLYAVFVALCGALFAAEPARSLRDVLTPDAFKKAGLEKLTDDELSFLSVQLFGEAKPKKRNENGDPQAPHAPAALAVAPAAEVEGAPAQGGTPPLPQGEAAFGNEEKLAVAKILGVPQEMKSRIRGPFSGWSGKTVFVLENGQTWQQSEPGEFDVNLMSPEITIKKGMFGAFYLRVAGYGSTVKVKRIR